MRGVAHQRHPPVVIVPRLGDPVANVGLVYERVFGDPGEG